ncbi:helix-turn-helix domain-containing protein [Streptomyces sp. NPDC047829]|uniref:AraC family transcriptional regulator n=1 Tax=Streptomyces sp. NPDC047829 TaxID=3154609 RepID=UPI0033D7C36A
MSPAAATSPDRPGDSAARTPAPGGPGSSRGTAPRGDTRGILDPSALLRRTSFRRLPPAPALRPYVEHYWLIDWDLPSPYEARVLPHPSVNAVLQWRGGRSRCEVSGVGLRVHAERLEGAGRVAGVQFRPGGFRPFAPGAPVSEWTGRRLPAEEVTGAGPALAEALAALGEEGDDARRAAAVDSWLLSLEPRPDPQAALAVELAALACHDRTVRRTARLAELGGLSVRALQRPFAAYVGVSPKWVILRYRLLDALERAAADGAADWAGIAAELGYADQAHLVRDFTATVGVPPTAYAARGAA